MSREDRERERAKFATDTERWAPLLGLLSVLAIVVGLVLTLVGW